MVRGDKPLPACRFLEAQNQRYAQGVVGGFEARDGIRIIVRPVADPGGQVVGHLEVHASVIRNDRVDV